MHGPTWLAVGVSLPDGSLTTACLMALLRWQTLLSWSFATTRYGRSFLRQICNTPTGASRSLLHRSDQQQPILSSIDGNHRQSRYARAATVAPLRLRCHRWTDSCRQSGVIHHLPARCDPLNQRMVHIDRGALLRPTSQTRCCAPPSLDSHSRRGARYAAHGLLWLISS